MSLCNEKSLFLIKSYGKKEMMIVNSNSTMCIYVLYIPLVRPRYGLMAAILKITYCFIYRASIYAGWLWPIYLWYNIVYRFIFTLADYVKRGLIYKQSLPIVWKKKKKKKKSGCFDICKSVIFTLKLLLPLLRLCPYDTA